MFLIRVQVYMSLEEARNFRRNLVDLLGLEDGSTAAACIEAVQRLLDHHARHLGLKANYLNRLEADQEAHRVERREREQVARGPKSTRAPEGWELPTSFFQSPVVAIPSRSSRWTPSPELRAERTRAPRHLYRDRDVSRSF